MRPNDYGVALQIFRVCIYNGHPEAAAPAMKSLQLATAQAQFNWLQLLFQSHLSGQRWAEAEAVARRILAMAPSDRNARGFLEHLARQGKQR